MQRIKKSIALEIFKIIFTKPTFKIKRYLNLLLLGLHHFKVEMGAMLGKKMKVYQLMNRRQ